jgi:hypothetical protein
MLLCIEIFKDHAMHTCIEKMCTIMFYEPVEKK